MRVGRIEKIGGSNTGTKDGTTFHRFLVKELKKEIFREVLRTERYKKFSDYLYELLGKVEEKASNRTGKSLKEDEDILDDLVVLSARRSDDAPDA